MGPNAVVLRMASLFTQKAISSYKEKRRIFLLSELAKAGYTRDSPELQKDDFIACFLATEDALNKCASREKITALANMLVSGVSSGRLFREPDAYAEILSIIEGLSERELLILYWLYKIEEAGAEKDQEEKVGNQAKYISERLGCTVELSAALLTRLERTGLLSVAHGYGGGKSHSLSALAKELRGWVEFQIDQGSIR
ncbi:hypothetical protein [Franzmannia qiaohouensis]|uniref:Uncharacterized protein n=1 Tax=Franzmannia qiaohouensis TaxID=1329370 RepID=A0ABU1HC55_9GAMM|nr:hypothetical protein [Halomonas qiaohouensis]MDR5904872.1 hypothetical protein [Halomonas qiaohouensis]